MINDVSKKINNQDSSGYRAREMDEKARKDREEKQRKLNLQKRDLELKEMDLRAQEEKYGVLRREITRLESQPKISVATTQSLERQNAAKITEDKNKIKALEQEMAGLDRTVESKRNLLISQKEQEEKKDSSHILEIREQIRLKTLELEKAESEDRELQQEIAKLKTQPKNSGITTLSGHPELKSIEQQNVAKVTAGKANIQKLNDEISAFSRDLVEKKQQEEKTNKDLIENQRRLLQEKTEEAKLTVNRITGLKDDIRVINGLIQKLAA